jgi:heat shock protein HslJ
MDKQNLAEGIAQGHNSRNALDWAGTYRGILPCADCEGIAVEIHLEANSSYTASLTYWKVDHEPPQQYEGAFQWDDEGGSIMLEDVGEMAGSFRVGENRLIAIHPEDSLPDGEFGKTFELQKIKGDEDIRGVFWQIVEIHGQKVLAEGENRQPAHLILDPVENNVYGSGGCNRFFGSCELSGEGQISFSGIATTRRACPDMELENALLEILASVERYKLKENQLLLYKESGAPLAVLKTLYRPNS